MSQRYDFGVTKNRPKPPIQNDFSTNIRPTMGTGARHADTGTIVLVKTRYLLFWSIGLLVVILAASAIWFITDPFGFLDAT